MPDEKELTRSGVYVVIGYCCIFERDPVQAANGLKERMGSSDGFNGFSTERSNWAGPSPVNASSHLR